MTDKENLKKMNQIYIQTQTLVEFIKKNEVAWQMYDYNRKNEMCKN